jgi:hypothetical protein
MIAPKFGALSVSPRNLSDPILLKFGLRRVAHKTTATRKGWRTRSLSENYSKYVNSHRRSARDAADESPVHAFGSARSKRDFDERTPAVTLFDLLTAMTFVTSVSAAMASAKYVHAGFWGYAIALFLSLILGTVWGKWQTSSHVRRRPSQNIRETALCRPLHLRVFPMVVFCCVSRWLGIKLSLRAFACGEEVIVTSPGSAFQWVYHRLRTLLVFGLGKCSHHPPRTVDWGSFQRTYESATTTKTQTALFP